MSQPSREVLAAPEPPARLGGHRAGRESLARSPHRPHTPLMPGGNRAPPLAPAAWHPPPAPNSSQPLITQTVSAADGETAPLAPNPLQQPQQFPALRRVLDSPALGQRLLPAPAPSRCQGPSSADGPDRPHGRWHLHWALLGCTGSTGRGLGGSQRLCREDTSVFFYVFLCFSRAWMCLAANRWVGLTFLSYFPVSPQWGN